MIFEPIHSAELSLRVITAADVGEAYVRWLNDPRVIKFLQVRRENITLLSQKEYVTKIYHSEDTCLFGIYVRENFMIGTIKVGPIDHKLKSGEIGLLIGELEYWGKGLASKSIGMLCEAFFSSGVLRKVTAGVIGENFGSKKAFEKNGFVVEELLKNHDVGADSEFQDVFRYIKISGATE